MTTAAHVSHGPPALALVAGTPVRAVSQSPRATPRAVRAAGAGQATQAPADPPIVLRARPGSFALVLEETIR